MLDGNINTREQVHNIKNESARGERPASSGRGEEMKGSRVFGTVAQGAKDRYHYHVIMRLLCLPPDCAAELQVSYLRQCRGPLATKQAGCANSGNAAHEDEDA